MNTVRACTLFAFLSTPTDGISLSSFTLDLPLFLLCTPLVTPSPPLSPSCMCLLITHRVLTKHVHRQSASVLDVQPPQRPFCMPCARRGACMQRGPGMTRLVLARHRADRPALRVATLVYRAVATRIQHILKHIHTAHSHMRIYAYADSTNTCTHSSARVHMHSCACCIHAPRSIYLTQACIMRLQLCKRARIEFRRLTNWSSEVLADAGTVRP